MGDDATFTVGLDLGDRHSQVCVLDASGSIVEESRIPTTLTGVRRYFSARSRWRVVLEVGTHSPWVSRLVREHGHEVLVANPRKFRLICHADRKSDRLDAEALARAGRSDPTLLCPIQHRGAEAQRDLVLVRSRATAVRARSQLIACVRGLVKSVGGRLPGSSSERFPKLISELPEDLRDRVAPLMGSIAELTGTIGAYDRKIAEVATSRYAETQVLQTVPGVGPVTALTYVLTLEDPSRFARSRDVGPYLGLSNGRKQSSDRDPQLPITKAGDPYLRQLLVGSANYLLGPFGPDCALRRWGQKLAARGGKNAKKRATVAVARKLAVVLHRMWVTNAAFAPFPDVRRASAVA
jgi:transposase